MTVAFGNDYELPANDYPLNHARMLHAGLTPRFKDITATDEVVAFPAEAVGNAVTVDRWIPFSNTIDPSDEFDAWTTINCAVLPDKQTLQADIIESDYFGISLSGFATEGNERVVGFIIQRKNANSVRVRYSDGALTFNATFSLHEEGVSSVESFVGAKLIRLSQPDFFLLMAWGTPALTASGGSLEIHFLADDGTETLSTDGSEQVRIVQASEHASIVDLTFEGYGSSDADCIGIASHNIGSGGGEIKLFPDGIGEDSDNFILEASPADDSPIMGLFVPQTAKNWILRIEHCVLPEIGVAKIGTALQWERPFFGGFSPSIGNRNSKVRGNVSEGGGFLGRSAVNQNFFATYSWDNLTSSWIRQNLLGREGLLPSLEEEAFFLAWRPSELNDVDYAWTDGSIGGWENLGVRDLASFNFRATVLGYLDSEQLANEVGTEEAPEITGTPVLSGSLISGGTITLTPGTVTAIPGSDPLYTFFISDDDSGTNEVIYQAASTDLDIVSQPADVGKYFRALQQEENIYGVDTAFSAYYGPVLAQPSTPETFTFVENRDQQSNGTITHEYSITADSNVSAVLRLASEAKATAADFNGNNEPTYLDLGTQILTTDGEDIAFVIPDGVADDTYIVDYLPEFGGDSDVVSSTSFTLDTTDPGTTTATAVTGSGSGEIDVTLEYDEAVDYRISIYLTTDTPSDNDIAAGVGSVATVTGSLAANTSSGAITLTGTAGTDYDVEIYVEDDVSNEAFDGVAAVTAGSSANLVMNFLDFSGRRAYGGSDTFDLTGTSEGDYLCVLVSKKGGSDTDTVPSIDIDGVTYDYATYGLATSDDTLGNHMIKAFKIPVTASAANGSAITFSPNFTGSGGRWYIGVYYSTDDFTVADFGTETYTGTGTDSPMVGDVDVVSGEYVVGMAFKTDAQDGGGSGTISWTGATEDGGEDDNASFGVGDYHTVASHDVTANETPRNVETTHTNTSTSDRSCILVMSLEAV